MTTPLPEPLNYVIGDLGATMGFELHRQAEAGTPYYTADQMRAYGAAEYRRAIEFAVSRCMYRSQFIDDMGAIIASDILNLGDAS